MADCYFKPNFYVITLSLSSTIDAATIYPKNITIPIGRNVTITCKVFILGSSVYTWERRYDKEWAVVGDYNSTAHTTSSFGQYRWKVYNTTTMTVSEVAVVIVQSQDTLNIIDSPPKRSFIKRGNFYTLNCNASGPGTVVYSWERRHSNVWTTISMHETSYNVSSPGQYRYRVTNEAESIVSNMIVIKYYSKCMCVCRL